MQLMIRVFVLVQAREINLSMSEEKSIKKLLHGFSLDLKKWTMTMEWSSTELIRNNNNDNNLEVCFANSSWNEYAILERVCSGAQSRLTFAVLKLFAEIQQVISSEKFAYIWYVYIQSITSYVVMQKNRHYYSHLNLFFVVAGHYHQQ